MAEPGAAAAIPAMPLRRDHYPPPPADEVPARARSGAIWQFAATATGFVLAFVVSVVLARLLAPADFGLVALAGLVKGLFSALANLGLVVVTIQADALDDQDVRELFWLNVLTGGVLTLVVLGITPLAIAFFREPRLWPVLPLLGSTYLIGSVAVQPYALMYRQMRLEALAGIGLAAAVLSALASIGSAVAGLGYWALVVGAVVGVVTQTIAQVSLVRLRPGRPTIGAAPGRWIRPATWNMARSLITYARGNIDGAIVGRSGGAADLGTYSRALSLMIMPSNIVFSSLDASVTAGLTAVSTNATAFARLYHTSLRTLAFASFPGSIVIVVFGPDLVRIVYGPTWSAVEGPLFWLAIASFFYPLSQTVVWLLIAHRRNAELVRWTAGATLVMLAALLVSARHGATAIAAAYSIATVVVFTGAGLAYAHRLVGIPLRATLRTLAPFAAVAAVTTAAGMAVRLLTTGPRSLPLVGGGIAACGIVYLGSALLVARPLPVLPAALHRTKRLLAGRPGHRRPDWA